MPGQKCLSWGNSLYTKNHKKSKPKKFKTKNFQNLKKISFLVLERRSLLRGIQSMQFWVPTDGTNRQTRKITKKCKNCHTKNCRTAPKRGKWPQYTVFKRNNMKFFTYFIRAAKISLKHCLHAHTFFHLCKQVHTTTDMATYRFCENSL